MSNSNKMTLEEKIVQKIKDDSLFALVGDEDAITALVKRAITEALFKERIAGTDGYGRTTTKPSPVMEATVVVADKIIKQVIDSYMADSETVAKIDVLIAATLPKAIFTWTDRRFTGLVDERAANAANELIEHRKKSGGL